MSDSSTAPTNRLAAETSPYLLQHRHNPVDWYPWGDAALDKAKAENKPILLSIGYAACHWCHVMAHESFEDPNVAALMNELFVNIKVDREERPDLDSIYQSALALLGEQGGWPLTMFLTPDGEPFWGGTYFPPTARYGRPGFPELLRGIAAAYRDDPERVATNVNALRDALRQLSDNQRGAGISLELADRIAEQIVRQFDPFHGGLGHAPKFPQPAMLKQLWRAWRRRHAAPFRHAVELTLTKMCQGGIYDHLGGGFARYAVDQAWLIPHFEKMLYDNAQLIEILTWVWQETRNPLYARRVRETVAWLQREMKAAADEAGDVTADAFASSLDADSEGDEGKFYVWQAAEIDALLGDDAEFFKAAYDVTPGGNWEGKSILNRSARPELLSDAEEARLAQLRQKLLAARDARVRPGWDDKVLADWNGLTIAALARAAPVFDEPEWLDMAEDAFRFICQNMQREGRLLHSWRHGRLQHPATLDDHANLCDAALALFAATGKTEYLTQAEAWLTVLDTHYWDSAGGGYFFTADYVARLIVRSKTAQDGATPAGNGTIAAVLAQLYHLTGKEDYLGRAEDVIAAFSGELERAPFTLSTLINAAEGLQSTVQIVIVGEQAKDGTAALIDVVNDICLPDRVLRRVEPGALDILPAGHPASGKGQENGRATAYVCRGTICSLPITDAAELRAALAG